MPSPEVFTSEILSADTLLIEFYDTDLYQSAQKVAALKDFLQSSYSEYCIDLIPAFHTLSIVVDFPSYTPQQLLSVINGFLKESLDHRPDSNTQLITLPCYYGRETGLDLDDLCLEKNISVEELIERHSQTIYTVFAIGFSPGFPYLGEVDSRIARPRLANPRKKVPWGSVGIAGTQTGIYPNTSPGGWNIIGRCPLPIFSIDNAPPDICLLKVGDTVRFNAIQKEEYEYLLENQDRALTHDCAQGEHREH
jgi:KipI family sensor histidine kinase inhibitor